MRTIRGWHEDAVPEGRGPRADASTDRTHTEVTHALLDFVQTTTDRYEGFQESKRLREQLSSAASQDFLDLSMPIDSSVMTINETLEDLGGLLLDITDRENQRRFTGMITNFDFKPGEEDLWVVKLNSFPKPLELTAQRLIGSVITGLSGRSSVPDTVATDFMAAAEPTLHTGFYN